MIEMESSPATGGISSAPRADASLFRKKLVVISLSPTVLRPQVSLSYLSGAFLQVLSLVYPHLLGVFPHVTRMVGITAFLAPTVNS